MPTARITIAPYGSPGNVDYVCAGPTGNESEINRAIAAASALPTGGRVYLKAGTYTCSQPIVLHSNVMLSGEGPATIIKRDGGGGYAMQNEPAALYDVVIEDITFLGNNSASGITTAIALTGSNDPDAPNAPVISNFTLRGVTMRHCHSLPVRLFGLSGKLVVTACDFDHNLDPGFGWNEEVVLMSNRSMKSKDNGFSISQGNRKVICVGNTVEGSAYYGIWLSGFEGGIGPSEFVCSGNVILDTRRSGIALINSPANGSVCGNYIDNNHIRPIDGIDGIQVYGDNNSLRAKNITVSGNTILNAPRAGISYAYADQLTITNNTIVNPGTEHRTNGTIISPTDTTTNIGILSAHLSNHRVWVDGNAIYDTRPAPLCNYNVWKVQSLAAGVTYGTNYSSGMRNDRNRLDLIDLPVESGSPVALNVRGPDANVDLQLNLKGKGELQVRGSNGGGLNIESATAGAGAQSRLRLSAGSVTTPTGQLTAIRSDASRSSLLALSVLANGSLQPPSTTAAPFYIQGSATSGGASIGLYAGLTLKRRAIADTAYTVSATDYIIAYTSLTGGRTVTLPGKATVGQTHIVKDETGRAANHNITVVVANGGTIDHTPKKIINLNDGVLQLYFSGTEWKYMGGIYNKSQLPDA